jgi:alpha-beta hydrolase superfamily lysophospholipase
VVVFVHGFGEHHRRHDLLAETLSRQNLAVLRYDQRGHGLSEGRRGDVDHYELLLDDLDLMISLARSEYADRPLFLYGHSMGGGVVANWAIHRPQPIVQGAVLSSPWLRLRKPPHRLLQVVGGAVSTIFPTWTVPTGIKAKNLASDPESLARYRKDPLIQRRISLRMVLAAIQSGEKAMAKASQCRLPLLVLHGTGDKITSPVASQQFASQAPDAELRLFEGLAHEMHFEAQAPQVIDHIQGWIRRRLSPKGPAAPPS